MVEPGADAADCSGLYRIYILVLLLAANALAYADRHLLSVLLPSIKDEFKVSDAMLGFIAGPAFIAPYVLLSVPLAALADRWSRRKVIALAVGVWSAATALCGMAANPIQLMLGRVLVGTGEAGGFPASQSVIIGLFPRHQRSTALGVLSSGAYIGLLLGLACGGALAMAFGWRMAFFILAAPGILVAFLIWTTVPRRSREISVTKSNSMASVIKLCWSIRTFRNLAYALGLFTIFGFAAAVWMPSYFMRSHGMTAFEAGMWMGIGSGIGGVAGTFVSGVIVDRLAARDIRWQLRVPAVGFMIAVPVIIATLLLPAGFVIEVGGVVIPVVSLCLIVNAFLTAFWSGPTYAALSSCVDPTLRAQVASLMIAIISIVGAMLGPLFTGFASDILTPHLGNEALRYSLLGLGSTVIAVAWFFWRAASAYRTDYMPTPSAP